MKAQEQMVGLIVARMELLGITQAEFARRLGRSPKHVNQVIRGRAGSMELDYWAFVLGARFEITLTDVEVPF
jgi:transcriptional regulator with XRE-family HTH domain